MAVDYLSTLNKNGSGLSLTSLSSSLVSAEIAPKRASAERKISDAQVSVSAMASVRAQFEKLDGAIAGLSGTPVLSASSSSSNISVIVDDVNAVSEGVTELSVGQIARRQVIEFTGFESPDDVIGSGQLDIEFGVWVDDSSFATNPNLAAASLTIPEGATLEEFATSLNEISGINARVLDRGDGTYTLGVVSELGAGNALRITATEGTTAGLSTFDNTLTNADKQVQAAADAMITVGGITVFRSTNTVDDVVDGMTLTLNGTSDFGTVSVQRDQDLARAMVGALVDEVNATFDVLDKLTMRGTEGNEAGDLAGDRVVRKLRTDLTNLLSAPLTGHGEGSVFLSDMGVSTLRDGKLAFNNALFERGFQSDPKKFEAIFGNSYGASDPNVEIGGLVGTDANSGSYAFSIDGSTGIATLDGTPLLATQQENGAMQYIALSGQLAGLTINAPAGLTDTTINFGRSLMSKLDSLVNETTRFAGTLETRERYYGDITTEQQEILTALDEKATQLEERYLKKFSVMEQLITEMKSTGDYLTNMVDSWNNK